MLTGGSNDDTMSGGVGVDDLSAVVGRTASLVALVTMFSYQC